MNVSSNLPKPTYVIERLFLSIESTKRLVKDVMLLAKKVLML